MQKSIGYIHLIVLLAVLSSVAPIATDTYLPAIPDIAKTFSVSTEKIELSLSVFLLGFSVGQIFGGPISDRYGRRKSSIFGLVGFAFLSLIIVFSSNIYELWIYRFVEAFFGGIIVVNATAAVRDRFSGAEVAKVFSLIGMVRSLAPLLAPAIGAFIIHFFSWSTVFIFLTIYAFVIAFWVFKSLPESFTRTKQNVIESYLSVITHKEAMKAMLTLALCFGGFFIIIARTSYIYIEYFKISQDYFPLFFGINFIFLMFLIKVNVNLLKKFSDLAITKVAIIIQVIAGLIFIANFKEPSIGIVMFVLACYMGMMAFIFGNCTALALEHFSQNAGVASGVIGVLQFGLGALISSLALSFESKEYAFLPMSISITAISALSFLIIRTYKMK